MAKWIRLAKKGRGTIIFADGKNMMIISKVKESKWLLHIKPRNKKLYFLSRNSAEYYANNYIKRY